MIPGSETLWKKLRTRNERDNPVLVCTQPLDRVSVKHDLFRPKTNQEGREMKSFNGTTETFLQQQRLRISPVETLSGAQSRGGI